MDNKVSKMYSSELLKYGDSSKSVHWKSPEVQASRFEILEEIDDLNGSTIFDIGCGKADLYSHLIGGGWKGNYVGYDASEEMLSFCKNKYPKVLFINCYLPGGLPKDPCDYAFISGTLYDKTDDEKFVEKVLTEVFSICKCGMAFNLLSTHVDYSVDGSLYVDPVQIFSFCMEKLSRFVVLRNDYARFEFTVYVYKNATCKYY